MYEFRMFISGDTVGNKKMVADITSYLTRQFGNEYDFQVVDVIKNPHSARLDGILATPSLVKVNPPMRKIFGDLSDVEKVFERLNLHIPPEIPDSVK
ncbi:MAG: circadian clock protein KaiB [Proteobacteria bacterium]|nr:circadian clock protein KaiB [Pseudomonadota bacterium]